MSLRIGRRTRRVVDMPLSETGAANDLAEPGAEPLTKPGAGAAAEEVSRRRDLRTAAHEVTRYWDGLQERIPAPVLRMLVTLPWLLRRMPVPFWVPLVLMLLRRIAKRRAKRRLRQQKRAA